MKLLNLLAIITITASLLIATSCNKEDDFKKAVDSINEITGFYTGTYDQFDGSKSTDPANAEVRYLGGTEVEIHCYGDMLDTTFVMDIYAEHDSIMLCATGNQFENTYGHMKGDYHMNHHGNNESEWEHHMTDDHNDSDQHYGGFNLSNHGFGYTFKIKNDSAVESIRFEGVRQD